MKINEKGRTREHMSTTKKDRFWQLHSKPFKKKRTFIFGYTLFTVDDPL